MKKLLLSAAVLFAGIMSYAQPYDWSVGARGSFGYGSINARHFLNSERALDLSGAFTFSGGWDVSGIFEWSLPVINDDFDFYYGAGAHVGSAKVEDNIYVGLGVVGVVGLEYVVPSVPLCLFIDYRPRLSWEFGYGLGFGSKDLGFGIRIHF